MSTQMAIRTNPTHASKLRFAGASSPSLITFRARQLHMVRCDAQKDNLNGLRGAVDRATNKTITKDEILHNQETNESEQKSVMGMKPKPGTVYGRPEVERRPETGSMSVFNIFAFDGALPETVNGRLAMLGITWAFFAEMKTGLTVFNQLFLPGQTGLVYFLGAVQLLTYASLLPILNGESTDARSFGPFTAKAERWNGRLATVGFFSLLVSEAFTQVPVFHWPVICSNFDTTYVAYFIEKL